MALASIALGGVADDEPKAGERAAAEQLRGAQWGQVLTLDLGLAQLDLMLKSGQGTFGEFKVKT